MLTKDQKNKTRNIIFRQLDAIAISTVLVSLNKNNIINFILKNNIFNSEDISRKFKTNNGYLNISLRLLASQGLLKQSIIKDGKNIDYILTKKGIFIFNNIKKYNFCIDWYRHCINLKINSINKFDFKYYLKIIELLELANNNWNLKYNNNINSYEYYIIKQLNGILIAPIIVFLSYNNLLIDESTFKKFILKNKFTKLLGKTLLLEKWITNTYNFTNAGNYVFNIGSSYGVTISYLPTFLQVDNLIFGNPHALKINSNLKKEIHINRKINVWGSGGSHKTYFRFIDKIIINILNKPLKEQPLGISDMGCGDGTFLIHINQLLKNTVRGKNLAKYPFYFIGADYNIDALESTKNNLTTNNIDHVLVKADISKPKEYAQILKEKYNLDLKKFLNIRSFLDHNRIFSEPINKLYHKSTSTCSFSSKGKWIPNYIIENNLIEHFQNWAPYIKQFGLILLELHSINPNLVKDNNGESLSTAYDATHGFSDQYIIELDIFLHCIKKAGLNINNQVGIKFPNNDLATISINYIN